MKRLVVISILISLAAIALGAPRRKYWKKSEYDFGQFDEIYDQRQNGTENYRIDLNKVVLVWTPPETLIQAALMLDPQLFEGDYPDVEEVLTNSSDKPEDLLVIRPDKPSSTTTAIATTITTEKIPEVIENENPTQKPQLEPKRKFRLPGFMRPFMARLL